MTTIKGVWVFVEAPDLEVYLPYEPVLFNFTSNGQAFFGMYTNFGPFDYISEIVDVDIGGGVIETGYNTVIPDTGSGWKDEGYRTIDFGETEQEVPDDFYAWFTANAVYQDVDPEPGPSPIVGTLKEEALKLRQNLDKIYEAGYEKGYVDHYDTFWDAYQENGSRKSYSTAFAGEGWTDETFKPKYNIVPITNFTNMFNATQITNLPLLLSQAGVTFDLSTAVSGTYLINNTKKLTDVPTLDCSSLSNINHFVFDNDGLRVIDKVVLKSDGSQAFNDYSFGSNPALEEIRFEGVIGKNGFNIQHSTLLSHDSLLSIINALQDKSTDTSGTVWLITLGGENIAKLTDDELNQIQQKGWTYK